MPYDHADFLQSEPEASHISGTANTTATPAVSTTTTTTIQKTSHPGDTTLEMNHDSASPDEIASLFPDRTSSPFGELMTDIGNMLKAFIGLNFMYVSFAFSKAGLVRGIIGLIVITVITEHCCLLLVKVKNAMPTPQPTAENERPPPPPTFADIAYFVGGRPAENAINAALVITQFGYCVGYLIFISQTIHDLTGTTTTVWPFVLIPLPPLLVLSMLKSIRSLGPFSLLANFALLAGFAAVVAYIGKHFQWQPSSPSIWSFPLFFGQMTAALEGIGLVIPVETSMKNKARFPMVLRIALVIMTLVLMTVGILGYVSFGDNTRSIILLNFGASPVVTLVKWVLVVGILFTYPLQLVPVIHATEAWVMGSAVPSEEPRASRVSATYSQGSGDDDMDGSLGSHDHTVTDAQGLTAGRAPSADESPTTNGKMVSDWRQILARTTIVIATGATAMLAGASFGLFQSLVGSVGASTLAYTAPSLFHLRVFRGELSLWQRARDWGIFVFGLLGSIIGTAVTVWEITQVHASDAVSP